MLRFLWKSPKRNLKIFKSRIKSIFYENFYNLSNKTSIRVPKKITNKKIQSKLVIIHSKSSF